MSKLLFITGKGGVGKSSFARALARIYSQKQKKTLLLSIDGFSLSGKNEKNALVAESEFLYFQKLHLHPVVEEYFTVTLNKIPMLGSLRKFTSKINEEVASKLLANKMVLKFIEACPGLTPTLFLGKICYEAGEGGPEQNQKWDIVIVDAPSTGQSLQIFESARSLSKVLSQGIIYKHIHKTLDFVYDKNFEIHLLTLAEEGPVQEALETLERFDKLGIKIKNLCVNRLTPKTEEERLRSFKSEDQALSTLLKSELDRIDDQKELLEKLKSARPEIKTIQVEEHSSKDQINLNALTGEFSS
jgi:anion-transporting  ArsA/GET3 family ATPase